MQADQFPIHADRRRTRRQPQHDGSTRRRALAHQCRDAPRHQPRHRAVLERLELEARAAGRDGEADLFRMARDAS